MKRIDRRRLKYAQAWRDAFELIDLPSAESLGDAHICSSINVLSSDPQFEQTVEIEAGATDRV